MHFDIATLVRTVLLDSGCDPILLDNFNSQSTIVLDFHDTPSIHISKNNNDIYLWSRIAEYQENLLEKHSYNLLKELLKEVKYARNGHYSLAKNENYLELKVLLLPRYVENKNIFSNALNDFFERLEHLAKMLNYNKKYNNF